MANSKANIYPIQLQGAQLNLNKFDAEIKQYNGFNKNNSPYVGGCLSPVFTKDEEHSGYTRNNTYVDVNGDVYHVDTSGLWKNDTKVLDTTGATFYDVEEVEIPSNTDTVYTENFYITKDEELNYTLVYNGIGHDIADEFNSFTSGEPYHFYIREKEFSSGAIYYFITYNGVESLKTGILIYKKNDTDLVAKDGVELSSSVRYFEMLYFQNNTEANCKIACFNRFFDGSKAVVLSFSNGTISSYSTDSFTLTASGTGENWLAYCFTEDYAYVGSGNIPTGVFGSNYLAWKFQYSIDFSTNVVTLTRIQNSLLNASKFKVIKGETSLWHPWGACQSFTVVNRDDTTKYVYLAICGGVLTNHGTCTNTSTNACSYLFGGVINDCVLINNGLVSGICLPSGWVLASEWNTVIEESIVFGKNTSTWRNEEYVCIWKNSQNNKWYKLVESDPWLKYINGQVVINADVKRNSYKISEEKKLLFAPAWNNRPIPDQISYNINLNTTRRDIYVATSINEYELADNSSIIINPLSVHIFGGSGTSSYDLDADTLKINYYQGTSDVKYMFSVDITTGLFGSDRNLIGLPFPSSTDGNIQYSPSLFAEELGTYGNFVIISDYGTAYKLMLENNRAVMSFYLTTAIEGLTTIFVIQGQLYGILNDGLYAFSFSDSIAESGQFIVSVANLKFVGNTPYQAFFFSPTNRCLYSFSGANVLNQAQFIDKFEDVTNYEYNPATQTIFMITDTEVIAYSSFGIYEIFFENVTEVYILEKGVCMLDNSGNFRYLQYYTDSGYTKENITLETCFYGTNDQTVNINDCLYIRLFDEDHSAGDLVVSASTLKNEGRKTENTTFKIKSSDWDELTHSIYLRYQPKEQRGLGVSFSINSPFKIASMSVGSMPDSVLIDKVSKGAINAPYKTTSNKEW